MDADFRAERRRFILAAHPDRGGDARAFVAGLQRFHDAATMHPADTHPADTHPDATNPADTHPDATDPADTMTGESEAGWPVSLLTVFLRDLPNLRDLRELRELRKRRRRLRKRRR